MKRWFLDRMLTVSIGAMFGFCLAIPVLATIWGLIKWAEPQCGTKEDSLKLARQACHAKEGQLHLENDEEFVCYIGEIKVVKP